MLTLMWRLVEKRTGLILLGHGPDRQRQNTTTLYSILQGIYTPEKKILTTRGHGRILKLGRVSRKFTVSPEPQFRIFAKRPSTRSPSPARTRVVMVLGEIRAVSTR